jgi:hypothetical protein
MANWRRLLEEQAAGTAASPWAQLEPRSPTAGASSWRQLVGAPVPERGGFLRTMVKEFGKDLTGAARTAGAVAFSPFDYLGVNVPITLDDLTTRDLTGAALVASMFVGGGIARAGMTAARGGAAAVRSADIFAKQLSAVQKASIWMGAEGTAGAFFGAVRPLEDHDSRLSTMLGDAALFAGFGGAFSLMGSAAKATIGARLAQIKGQTRQAALGDLAHIQQTRTFLQEFVGLRLRSPETQRFTDIRRLADGRVQARTFNAAGEVVDELFPDFNAALSESFSRGYVERWGLPRSQGHLTNLEGLHPEVVATLRREGASTITRKDILRYLDQLDLGGYEAVRVISRAAKEQDQLLTWLGVEAITDNVSALGVPQLSASVKANILKIVPKDVARRLRRTTSDGDFLREAVLAGVIDFTNVSNAMEARSMIRELVVNSAIPVADPAVIIARAPFDVGFLSKFATSKTLSRAHPEIVPLFETMDAAASQHVAGSRALTETLRHLDNTLPTDKLQRIVAILDDVQDVPSISEARRIATEAASSTNDLQIMEGMAAVQEMLNSYRLRAVAAGRLGFLDDAAPETVAAARRLIGEALEGGGSAEAAEKLIRDGLNQLDPPVAKAAGALLDEAGRAGYFPIANVGQYRLELDGVFHGFYRTLSEAQQAIVDSGRAVPASITPTSVTSDFGFSTVSGKDFGKMVKAVREAHSFELTSAEAAQLLRATGISPSATPGVSRKFSGFLQPRKLGLRDFSEDPARALRLYAFNMERTLAYSDFERQATQLIENIPAHKTQLKAWAETQVDLMLGRPTWTENLVQNWAERLRPGDVEPRLLRRYSAIIRRLQSNFRLGGIFSGLVNATQTAVNTAPMIGVDWTGRALGKWFSVDGRREIMGFFARENIDLGIHTGLGKDGRLIGSEKIKDSIKDAIRRRKIGENTKAAHAMMEAAENLWMISFNGAERMNRFVAAWGAYQKGIAPQARGGLGMSKESALRYAQEVVEKTQFNYRPSNIPQIMQGPIGGLMLQFKTFFINEIELLALADNRTRLRMLAGFQAVGGAGTLLTIPGLDLVDHASALFFDVKLSEALKIGAERAREADATVGGLTQFAAFGLPGMFAVGEGGLDMSRGVGLGGFMEITEGWAGPTGSDIGTLFNFSKAALADISGPRGRVHEETAATALRQLVPSQVRRIMNAYDIISTGEVRSPYTGKLVYRPEDRMRSAIAAAVGTPEVERTTAMAHDQFVNRQITAYRSARDSYRKQIALALLQGRTGEAEELRQRALTAGIVFTEQDLRRAIESFSQTAAERRAQRAPVDIREDMREFYGLPRR